MSRLPEALRAHLLEPRHVGPLVGPAVRRGEAFNAACRDRLVLFLEDDGAGRVGRAAFQATGCPACLALGSVAAELAAGQALDAGLPEALAASFRATHGEPSPLHRHALALVVEAARDALG